MSGVIGRPHRGGADDSVTAEQRERPDPSPWHALWAMMVGFFMILVDSTIVTVANPSIMSALDIGYDTVIWVTSAYLLAYAVPLLVAGRLGDRYGPKHLYLVGLAVFTAASLWCGLAGGIGMLIIARVVQGVGAALLTPQTLSMITRTFPPARHGMAMSVWGATAGLATLAGPLTGGILVDALGWEWIFFVNVPVGLAGLVLGAVFIPDLPTHAHRFDLLGVVLSGLGIFLIVFALQEGQSRGWAPWIGVMSGVGIVLLMLFVYWQRINTAEPLIPLAVFRDRDFGLANLGVAVIGFVATAMMVPVMFYAQAVCGLTPTWSAVLTAPTAVATGVLAPVVGRITDRAHPRSVTGFGFSLLAIALTWLAIDMTPTTPLWRLALAFAAIGVGMSFIWSPLAATATRNLPPQLAGAGSGVYNATRQIGSVLGSAGIAAFMASRVAVDMPQLPDSGHPRGFGSASGGSLLLPEFLHEPFALAMSNSVLLPAAVTLIGVAAAVFMAGRVMASVRRTRWTPPVRPAREPDGFEAPTEPIPPITLAPADPPIPDLPSRVRLAALAAAGRRDAGAESDGPHGVDVGSAADTDPHIPVFLTSFAISRDGDDEYVRDIGRGRGGTGRPADSGWQRQGRHGTSEDVPEGRLTVAEILARNGYVVRSARTGRHGLPGLPG